MTTRSEISAWFDEGLALGASNMLVVCDGFDYTDYPVYVMPEQVCRDVAREHDGPNMTRLMEVYSYLRDKDKQMAEPRAWHYEQVEDFANAESLPSYLPGWKIGR